MKLWSRRIAPGWNSGGMSKPTWIPTLGVMGLDATFDRTYISLIERGINSPTTSDGGETRGGVLKGAPSKIVVRMEQLLATPEK
jgi:hypothetical protein